MFVGVCTLLDIFLGKGQRNRRDGTDRRQTLPFCLSPLSLFVSLQVCLFTCWRYVFLSLCLQVFVSSPLRPVCCAAPCLVRQASTSSNFNSSDTSEVPICIVANLSKTNFLPCFYGRNFWKLFFEWQSISYANVDNFSKVRYMIITMLRRSNKNHLELRRRVRNMVKDFAVQFSFLS